MRRIVAVLFAVCVCIGGVVFSSERTDIVYAQERTVDAVGIEEQKSEGFRYTIKDDGTVSITDCYLGKNVVIPETLDGRTVTEIGDHAFSGFSSLTSISLPEGVTDIGGAFSGCSSLTSINIPKYVTEIGREAFSGCSSLTSIRIPESVASIGNEAFDECTALKDIYYSGSEMQWETTAEYLDLSGVTVHFNCTADNPSGTSSKTYTGNNQSGTGNNTNSGNNQNGTDNNSNTAPASDTKLTDTATNAVYTVTESGKTVTYTESTNQNTDTIIVPDTVKINGITYKITSISDNAFANRKNLKSVIIGKNITSIGKKAFYKCTGLTKITIPSTVAKIGKQAFAGCTKLKNITIKTSKLTKKNVGSKAFSGIHKQAKIKVPKKKLTAYKQMLKAKGIGSKAKVVK